MVERQERAERLAHETRFGLFLLQVRRQGPEDGNLEGVIERLGTGEKRPFGSVEELVDAVDQWCRRPSTS